MHEIEPAAWRHRGPGSDQARATRRHQVRVEPSPRRSSAPLTEISRTTGLSPDTWPVMHLRRGQPRAPAPPEPAIHPATGPRRRSVSLLSRPRARAWVPGRRSTAATRFLPGTPLGFRLACPHREGVSGAIRGSPGRLSSPAGRDDPSGIATRPSGCRNPLRRRSVPTGPAGERPLPCPHSCVRVTRPGYRANPNVLSRRSPSNRSGG
jgi:hypothetical protein